MLTMTQKNDIRKLFYEQGMSISQIARETGHDRKTVRQYVNQHNWNTPPKGKSTVGRPVKLEPFKEIIDEWLLEDKRARKKQRHTGKRVFNRLKKLYGDEFNCCYKTVSNYVTARKKEIYRKEICYLPLEHKPGEAQADFGEADFYENGKLYHGHYLNLSFPYSNQGYLQIFKGENQECLFEGLIIIFNYLNGIPNRIWFDNASTMVIDVLRGGNRNLTDDFMRFNQHYGFEAVFCNPAAGHEKGSVENKVGYHRRNMLVPIPEFRDIREYNKELLIECDQDGEREHYRKEKKISELHQKDKEALLQLPAVAFEAAKYQRVRTNTYGKFTLNNGLHEYSTAPKFAGQKVTIRLDANEVAVLDENLREVVIHKRLYGKGKQQSMQWLPYLSQLSRKPGALKYTGIFRMLPDPLQEYMELCEKRDKGKILQVILQISKDTGFDTAVETVTEALTYGAADPDSLLMVHTRLTTPNISLKPVKVSGGMPDQRKVTPNISAYDLLLKKAGERSC